MALADDVLKYAAKYRMFNGCEAIVCGVSGGCDSVCLLHVLYTLQAQLNIKIYAAHFNHLLRGAESDRDEAFVQNLCAMLGIELFTGRGDVRACAEGKKIGIEEAARQLRYDFFKDIAGKIKGCKIATAHNMDDNAETLLLNLTRGAGMNGLSGIPPVRDIYIRPLLSVKRTDIEAYLKDKGLEHVEDSTNTDTAYSRNRLRHEVIPVLKSINPAFAETAFKAAALIREDNEFLSMEADKLLHNKNGAYIFDINKLKSSHKALVSRAVIGAANGLGVRLSTVNVDAVLTLIGSDNASASIDLPCGLRAVKSYETLTISGKDDSFNAASFEQKELSYNNWTELIKPAVDLYLGDCENYETAAEIKGKFYGSDITFFFKKEKICGNIIVRPRKTGDFIELPGRNGHKSLKKLFIELKIPRNKREMIPVFADAEGVIAVAGIGADARAAIKNCEKDAKNTIVLIIRERKSDA